jgi:hypothetical protein
VGSNPTLFKLFVWSGEFDSVICDPRQGIFHRLFGSSYKHVDEIRDKATPGEFGLDGRANSRHAQHVHAHTLPDLHRSHSPLNLPRISYRDPANSSVRVQELELWLTNQELMLPRWGMLGGLWN